MSERAALIAVVLGTLAAAHPVDASSEKHVYFVSPVAAHDGSTESDDADRATEFGEKIRKKLAPGSEVTVEPVAPGSECSKGAVASCDTVVLRQLADARTYRLSINTHGQAQYDGHHGNQLRFTCRRGPDACFPLMYERASKTVVDHLIAHPRKPAE